MFSYTKKLHSTTQFSGIIENSIVDKRNAKILNWLQLRILPRKLLKVFGTHGKYCVFGTADKAKDI